MLEDVLDDLEEIYSQDGFYCLLRKFLDIDTQPSAASCVVTNSVLVTERASRRFPLAI